jgi:hypothetical protein
LRNLSWKLVIALLTFFIGTVLALTWITFNNKTIKSLVKVSSPSSEIEALSPVVAKTLATPLVASKSTQVNGDEHSRPVHFAKGGGKFCESYLLKKIAKEKAEGNRVVKLKNFNPDDETLSSNTKDWLEDMDEDRLVAFELRNKEMKALLLGSTNNRATGLASSLEFWRVEVGNTLSVIFVSFSENPKLVFWDKNGLLNYYSVVYSSEFMHNKDWENLTVDLNRYRISHDGSAQLVSAEQNVKCE